MGRKKREERRTRTRVLVSAPTKVAYDRLVRSQTEVAQVQLRTVLIGQDILRLEIPVGDLRLVERINSVHERDECPPEKLVVTLVDLLCGLVE